MAEQALSFDEEASARKVETIYLTPDVAAQRARVLDILNLQPGEQVADLGCGPGLLAEAMGRQVGDQGAVTCIDSSASMLTLARRRCAAQPRIAFDQGDVASPRFADQSFDVVVCTQVYEYVAEVDHALAELRRILKSGGRALIMDTDWESVVWANDDTARMRRVLDAWDKHCAHPQLPRTLFGRLQQAGLALERLDVITLVNHELDVNTYSYNMIDGMAAYVCARGGIPREEARAWSDDLKARTEPGSYFFSLSRYVFLARRLA